MSKLRRSISDVFRHKKTSSSRIENLPPVPSLNYDRYVARDLEDEDTIAAMGPFVQEEHQLQEAVMESLRDRNATLEQEKNRQTSKALHLEQQMRVKADDIERLKLRLNHLEVDRSRTQQSEATIQRLENENQTIKRERLQLSRQTTELKQNLKEYQVYVVKMSETQAQLQEENRDLLETNNSPIERVRQEKITLKRRVRVLEKGMADKQAEYEKQDMALVELHQQKSGIEEENKELTDRMAIVVQEIEHAKTVVEQYQRQLELQQQTHDREIQEALHNPWSSPTPRMILINDLLSQVFPEASTTVQTAQATQFLQSCSMATLTETLLDLHLSSQQARKFAENASNNPLALFVCDSPRQRVLEIYAADKLLLQIDMQSMLLEVIDERSGIWLVAQLGVQELVEVSNAELSACFASYSSRSSRKSSPAAGGYGHRKQDGDCEEPRPSDEALQVAADLHTQLATVGRMYSLFDPVHANREPDDAGRIQPFKPGRIQMIKVDHGVSSITAPLFMRFIKRQRTPKECAVCTDEFFDICYNSVEEWIDLCAGFHGEWMWKILLFPVKLGSECGHEIDFCTVCLQQHLKTQLQQHGRNRCDQLACPSDGCARRLSYEEIRLYAEDETFAEYDRYLSLNTLSRLPSFRWCLGPDCSNGQLYDDEGVMDPRIRCEECGFEMCYNHSIPWHEGQTCEQFNSVREHGDPEFQQTQDWITNNTKPCPNCKENIQKGEYCFHMTCEFPISSDRVAVMLNTENRFELPL
ncbi:Ff.00g049260.m01.CDS01 [Fusarium sp. VM40]|nr:Ff.00g049260.m01.CDS01 [Fusarium sp. VM40]